MRALNEIYDFITGGSIVAPFGLAIAIVAAFALPHLSAPAFVAIVAATFVFAAFEKPN